MMKYSLKVPCSKSKLKTIRSFVDETLGQYTISDVDLNMLVLAVDEMNRRACIYVSFHLYDKYVVLRLFCDVYHLTLRLKVFLVTMQKCNLHNFLKPHLLIQAFRLTKFHRHSCKASFKTCFFVCFFNSSIGILRSAGTFAWPLIRRFIYSFPD